MLGVSEPQSQHGGQGKYSNCSLELLISAPGIESFQASAKKTVLETSRRPQPGEQIPVDVDRSDPTRFEVAWKELPTTKERMSMRAEQLKSAGTVTGMTAAGGAGNPMEIVANSTSEALDQLSQLHAQGALSDQQFEMARQQISGA